MFSRLFSFTIKVCVVVVIAVGLLLGPAGFGPGEQSAEAASPVEVQQLTAAGLGHAVAVSGDTAIVEGPDSAYVFQRDEGGPDNWGEVTKLVASDFEAGDAFGFSVAVSGDTAVVGALRESAGGSNAGAAYVFQRDVGGPDNWGEVKKLTASDAGANDAFGFSVAVSGDTAVVGAFFADNAGAAYVFQRDQGGPNTWGEVKKLTASDAQDFDFFGWSAAVSGDSAIVGAVRSGLAQEGMPMAGAAYLFQRDEGGADNWGEVKKLTASDAEAGDHFGEGVAVSGDTAVVGALHAGGFNGPGTAYVFQRDEGGAGNWGEVTKLTASDAQDSDQFGVRVAVSGDTAYVGATHEDTEGFRAGAAYVFRRTQGGTDNWGEVTKLTASDAQELDSFGLSVAVSGDIGVVGKGAGGAAYVFQEPPPEPVGGIAELPDVAGTPLETGGSSGPGAGAVAGIAVAVAAGAVALGGAALYARRRWR